MSQEVRRKKPTIQDALRVRKRYQRTFAKDRAVAKLSGLRRPRYQILAHSLEAAFLQLLAQVRQDAGSNNLTYKLPCGSTLKYVPLEQVQTRARIKEAQSKTRKTKGKK